MRSLALALFALGCAANPSTAARDGGLDASEPSVDAGSIADAGSIDAAPIDGGADAGGLEEDAGPTTDGGGCAIHAGHTLALDGAGDPGEYPASQVLSPGAPLSAADTFALTWDASFLYVTVSSSAFDDAFEPLHVYVEARAALGAPSPSAGKEYGSHTALLPFTPTHVIAARRTSDSGTGGAYNGVYTPAGAWSDRATPLELGSSFWVSGDDRTLSVQVPWSSLGGCPSALRLSAHVVHGELANEWKDLVPASATPWTGEGGGYYELDLRADPAISGWALR